MRCFLLLFIAGLNKLKTYFLILFVLLFFNLIFNLIYSWDGISLIVRIYIFIISFSIVYTYSEYGIEDSLGLNSKSGYFISLFYNRLLPFIIIYLITVVYTVIGYAGNNGWYYVSVIDLLDGKFSNTMIYSLILLVMLKIKGDPKKTILIFLLLSVMYFGIDKILYIYFIDIINSSVIKIIKFMVFFLVLFFEYFQHRMKVYYKILYSLIATSVLYLLLVFIFASIHNYSSENAVYKFKTSYILLKMGLTYPFRYYEKQVFLLRKSDHLDNLFSFSKRYGCKIDYSQKQLNDFIENGSLSDIDIILQYVNQNLLDYNYAEFISLIEIKSKSNSSGLSQLKNIIKFIAQYFPANKEKLLEIVNTGNVYQKMWVLEILKTTPSFESIPVLVELLLDLNGNIRKTAYQLLIKKTGIDPVKNRNVGQNSIEAIHFFLKKYKNLNKDQ